MMLTLRPSSLSRLPFQLFKTAEKGWGIRSLIDLPAGTFVCIYAGMILTDLMADQKGREAGDEYFADLDLIQSVVSEKERQGIDLIDDAGIGSDDADDADSEHRCI
jgi:histone-lysine N-methyltransferase SETDB1